MEILPFYRNLFELFQSFRENLDGNLGNFIRKISLYRGRGDWAPEASEFIKNLLGKSMETSKYLEICINAEWFCLIKMRTLIKIKVSLMVSWNSLLSIKVIKKPSCKFLRDWTEIQLRLKFLRKHLNLHTKISLKVDILPIFCPIFQDLCHFIHLSKNKTIFPQHIFGFGGAAGSFPFLPAAPLWTTSTENSCMHYWMELQLKFIGRFSERKKSICWYLKTSRSG